MATAIFMILMVCGYWYTNRDLTTRYKFNRSSGWDVYFLIALYGCIFILQGMVVTFLLWLCLFGLSLAMNHSGIADVGHQQLQWDFLSWQLLGLQAPVMCMLAFAVLFCLYRSNWAHSANLNTDDRRKLYKHLTQSNGVEGLLFQCMEEGELAWITLKSRRIYIGMIHTASFENASMANIVLIPMLSGYRDGKTLSLCVEHNYSAWYAKHNIGFKVATNPR